MKLTIKKLRQAARFNWRIGFGMILYFLFLALVNILFKSEWPFMILSWPMYVFTKHAGFAATMEMLFAYIVSIFLVIFFDDFIGKKTNSSENSSKKESSAVVKKN